MKVEVYDQNKKKVGDVDLNEDVFAAKVNVSLMNQIVKAKLAAQRAGNASTKTRKEVSGTSAKMFKQKGTGRARQGDGKSPHLRGGGIAFGPHPRSFELKVNKKMFKAALHSALSQKQQNDSLYIVNDLKFNEIKTKQVVNFMNSFGIKKCLLVDDENTNLFLSSRNIYGVKTLKAEQLNPYDILKYENIVITKAALQKLTDNIQ